MNNDLEQFSEERLEEIIECSELNDNSEIAALARIALAAKQAKPVADDVLRIMQEEWDEWCADTGCFPDDFEWKGGNGTLSFEASRWAARIVARVSNLATPQPAHTEQDGWTSSDAANAALVMLDRIDTTDPVDDDRIEGIQRIIRQLVNSPVIPDGWKLVPIEPTQEMVDAHISGMQSAGFSRAYRDMLAAAPKPESE